MDADGDQESVGLACRFLGSQPGFVNFSLFEEITNRQHVGESALLSSHPGCWLSGKPPHVTTHSASLVCLLLIRSWA